MDENEITTNDGALPTDDATLTTTAEVDSKQTPPPSDEERLQSDVDAFQKGVDSIKDPSIKEPADATSKEKTSTTPAKPAEPGKPPGAEKPATDPAKEAPKDGKTNDPDVEKEITALALKGKSAERFREMAGEIKTTRPMMETLKGLNVTDQTQLNAILKDASAGLQWEQAVMDSTAKPEQLSSALQIIKAMNSSDPKLQGMALDAMLGECKVVAERMGREIPGLTGDVLDKHPDLKQAVDALDITREHALELAKARAMQSQYDARDTAVRQSAQQREQLAQQETAEYQRIDELSETLKASDPHFGAKLEAMKANGSMARVAALPVNQRYNALLQAYRAIPAPVAAPAPSPAAQTRIRPGQITNRGNNVSGNGVARTKFNSDVEAFEFGVASASKHQ